MWHKSRPRSRYSKRLGYGQQYLIFGALWWWGGYGVNGCFFLKQWWPYFQKKLCVDIRPQKFNIHTKNGYIYWKGGTNFPNHGQKRYPVVSFWEVYIYKLIFSCAEAWHYDLTTWIEHIDSKLMSATSLIPWCLDRYSSCFTGHPTTWAKNKLHHTTTVDENQPYLDETTYLLRLPKTCTLATKYMPSYNLDNFLLSFHLSQFVSPKCSCFSTHRLLSETYLHCFAQLPSFQPLRFSMKLFAWS